MSALLRALQERVEQDPLPAAHTSSHWQLHGRHTVVEFAEDDVRLQASGFETVAHPRLGGRLLHAAEWWSYRGVRRTLRSFPAAWRAVQGLLKTLGGGPDFYALKNACALATLADHWTAYGLQPRVAAVIGDGAGFFGALLRRWQPRLRLSCIDLPKILVFQARTHEQADPAARLGLVGAPGWEEADVVFVPPQEAEGLPGPVDCAVNMASMQEMTPESIAGYFRFLRRRSSPQARFYCINREEKVLPGGEVARFIDYPWGRDDEVFLDGPCPYYTHFFAPYTLPRGPKVLGWRVPCVNSFDGGTRHRLVHLAPEAGA